MTDVTIDEMLEWFDKIMGRATARVGVPYIPAEAVKEATAIRAILEQHKSQAKFLNTLDAMHIKAVEQRAMEAVLELERVKAAKLEDITVYGYKMNEVVAILEQHRDSIEKELVQCSRCLKIKPDVCVFYCGDCDPDTTVELEAIRAFVERVEKRPEHWKAAIMNELAAMEANDRTND